MQVRAQDGYDRQGSVNLHRMVEVPFELDWQDPTQLEASSSSRTSAYQCVSRPGASECIRPYEHRDLHQLRRHIRNGCRRMGISHPKVIRPTRVAPSTGRTRRLGKRSHWHSWRPRCGSRLRQPVVPVRRVAMDGGVGLVEGSRRTIRIVGAEGVCIGIVHADHSP